MPKRTLIVILLFIVLLSAGCGKIHFGLIDGYYTAEAAEFDDFGWKEYLTICVSGGKIILVEYNAYNSSGFIKSWDMDYMRVMNAADGTYPNAYTRHYGALFLKHQGLDGIDALSGASHSYLVFTSLAEAVLENAQTGNSKTALVQFGELH